VLRKLSLAAWPGNARQLRNEVIRLAACARQNLIVEDDLWEEPHAPPRDTPPSALKPQSLKKAVEDLERTLIAGALEATKNNPQQAARLLGLSRQGLINKLKRYSL